MRFVLTNDDGFGAPGLAALSQAVNGDAMIVAPVKGWSGCGHQVTTYKPIAVTQEEDNAYTVGGTPADCTRIALTQLDTRTEYVLAGINAGGNLGADVYMSGTVAAAREAALLGVTGIAFSHYKRAHLDFHWDRAARWAAAIIKELIAKGHQPGVYWNVNLPNLETEAPDPEIAWCGVCTQPLPVTYSVDGGQYLYTGVYPERPRTPGADVDQCMSGKITISRIVL